MNNKLCSIRSFGVLSRVCGQRCLTSSTTFVSSVADIRRQSSQKSFENSGPAKIDWAHLEKWTFLYLQFIVFRYPINFWNKKTRSDSKWQFGSSARNQTAIFRRNHVDPGSGTILPGPCGQLVYRGAHIRELLVTHYGACITMTMAFWYGLWHVL